MWNNGSPALVLNRLPYFYQTKPFLAACVIAVGLCGYGFYQLRIRRLESVFRLVLAERSRLAREIHDTVLQGFAGVVCQLEAASVGFAKSPELSKARLDRALDQADQSLRDARRAITCMRLPALENSSLPEALLDMGKQAAEGTSIGFDLAVKGKVRELRYQTQAALFLIGREAVTNAANHAQPRRITLLLAYSDDGVRLTVRDDGTGFDPGAPREDGHYGMAGMRERAREIGADFELSSHIGEGTAVMVAVAERLRDAGARHGSNGRES
jgi:signal transduction histidine kinase